MLDVLKVIILGIVEGITEWLPVSSTGHLILVGDLLSPGLSDEFMEMFNVVIQLGAIMAVVVLYFHKLNPFSPKKTQKQKMLTWQMWIKVVIACVPAAVIGLLFDDILDKIFYKPLPVAIMLIVITLAAFAFARLEFRGKNIAFALFLSLMMIPNELVIITNFVTITNLDLRNSFLGLILPSVTSVFYIYLLRENFAQIPDELYYAAKVDGTSDLRYLRKVMIPICRPTLITIIILKVIECWNSYVWPRLITDDPNYYLVSNGIQEIRENGFGRENIPAMMAAVVVISLPLIVLFLIFRKKVMAGVSRGGTKG